MAVHIFNVPSRPLGGRGRGEAEVLNEFKTSLGHIVRSYLKINK